MGESFTAVVERNGFREEKEIIREQTGFDGATGQPVYTYRFASGFDGMTGEAIYTEVEQAEFDGMTGQPVYRVKGGASSAKKSAAQKAGLSLPSFDLKKYLPFIIIGGSVLLLVAIFLILWFNDVFLSKRDKVAVAAYRTLEESTIGEMAVNAGELFSSNELTVQAGLEGSIEGYNGDLSATVARDSKDGKLSVKADVDMGGMLSQEVNFYFDDSSVQVSLPDINDEVYLYDYTADNEGAVADLIYDYTDGEIEDLNTVFRCANNFLKSNDAYVKEVKSSFKKAYKEVEVEKIDSEEFEIDGKDRKCKGYEMHITEENIEDFIRAYSDAGNAVYGDDIEELLYAVANLTGEDDLVEEYQMTQDSESMARMISEEIGTIDIDFYLYGGKLAAIIYEDDDVEITVEFQGGDTRCSNMVFTVDTGYGKDKYEIKSSRSGNKEKGKFSYNGYEGLSYTYDLKKGNFSIDVDGNTLDGILLVKKDNLKFQMDYDVYYFGSGRIKVNAEDEARIAELKGDIVDIGDIDEDELEGTAYRLFQQLGDAGDVLDYLF